MTRDSRLRSWLRQLGESRFGQRTVSMDSETQTLLNRLGWRRANQRSLFAALQLATPLVAVCLVLFVQEVAYPRPGTNGCCPCRRRRRLPAAQTRPGLCGPAAAKADRPEISTFIPLLRILFESGMAVEQALRVLGSEAQKLLPELTHELRLILARVDSGLELGQELNQTATLLAVDEFTDTCVILQQLILQGGGAMKSLQALKQLLDDRRLTRLQEYISKMSAKMSVVMMLFLFPALLIVLAGPGFTAIVRAFAS